MVYASAFVTKMAKLKFADGESWGSNGAAVSGADNSPASARRQNGASRSRFALGWICALSANVLPGSHSISGIAETIIVCHSPRLTRSLENSSFRVLLTRGVGRWPLHPDQVTLSRTFDEVFSQLRLAISCRQSDWQLSSLAQICSSSFPQALISVVESLVILEESGLRPHWQDDSDIERSQWLDLLHPFTAVKDLYIYPEFVPRIAPALQELVRERVTGVLPAFRALYFREPPPRTGPGSSSSPHDGLLVTHRCFQWPVRKKK